MEHQHRWRTELNALRADKGIPAGLRISIGGSLYFSDDIGSLTIEYQTYRLRKGEAFLVFIDGDEVLKVTAKKEVDSGGFSVQKSSKSTFKLKKGRHLIQFSVESRNAPKVISSYWDTQDQNMEIDDGIESLAEVAITRITIEAAPFGGAFECVKCREGTVAKEKSWKCTECPEGHEPKPDQSECVPCKEGYFNADPAGKCKKCP